MLAQGHPFRIQSRSLNPGLRVHCRSPSYIPQASQVAWDFALSSLRYLCGLYVGGYFTLAWSQERVWEIHNPKSSLWPELMRAGAKYPSSLPGPSGEIAVSKWTWAPVAHSICLNHAPSICCILSLGSFPHLCWYFSDITFQINLFALKSLTRHLLLKKPKFDTRTQLTTAHRLLKEAHYHPHQQTQRSVQKVGSCGSKASL